MHVHTVLQPAAVHGDVPHQRGGAAGKRFQNDYALRFLVAAKQESIRAAVGIAQLRLCQKTGKTNVGRCFLHRFADVARHKQGIGIPEP